MNIKFLKENNIFLLAKILLIAINIIFCVYLFFFLKNSVYIPIAVDVVNNNMLSVDSEKNNIINEEQLNRVLQNIEDKKIKNTEKKNISNFFHESDLDFDSLN
jgi:hypothetical protein